MMESIRFSKEENIGFWKNIILVTAFFVITPLTLCISLYSLFSLKSSVPVKQDLANTNLIISPQSGVKVYASLPTEFPSISEQITSSDARPEILRQYMKESGSPLAPYSGLIVEAADKYKLDFRLITAIARQESNLCKIIPPGSYNCWGWGVTGQDSFGFSSFQDGVEIVSKGLRENYLDKGYVTVDDIMNKYTPLSNGSWADAVNEFMTDMQ